jgi:hypothetical protein
MVVLAACSATVASGTQSSAASPTQAASQEPTASPKPAASPTLPVEIASPTAVGTAVGSRVLPPARVLPAVPLCTTPVQVFQDGNAGPLLCRGGAVNVAAWQWFQNHLQPPVLAAGPGLSEDAQKAALCRGGPQNMTNPERESAYWLAAVYYGWTPIDVERVLAVGGCR